MRKYIAPLVAVALMLSFAAVASASPFPDVPAYHWAYDAVRAVADLEIYEGYPDGEFKGDDPLSRYESALVVARLLTVVDAKIRNEIDAATIQAGDEDLREAVTRIIVESGDGLTGPEVEARFEEFVAALQALRSEFSSELSTLGVRVDSVDSLIAAARAEIADIKDTVAAHSDALSQLDRRVAELEARSDGTAWLVSGADVPEEVRQQVIETLVGDAVATKEETKASEARLEGKISSLEGRTDQVESVIASLKNEDSTLGNRIGLLRMRADAAEDAISEIRDELRALSDKADATGSKVSELDAEVASLKDQDVTLNNRIGLLRMRVDAAEDAISEIRNELRALSDKADATESKVSELGEEVASLKDQDVTLNNRIGLLRMRADAAEDAILELRGDFSDYTAANTAEIEDLKQRLSDVEGKYVKLNQSIGLAAVLAIVAYGMTR